MKASDEKIVFLTGATGFVGRNLMARILNDKKSRLLVLIRAADKEEASQRLLSIWQEIPQLSGLPDLFRRVEIICGDVSLPNLGIGKKLYDETASKITHILHCAATVKFNLPLECAKAANVAGTEYVSALARRAMETGSFRMMSYVGTAFVSGDRPGIIYEDELDCGQRFENSYEKTKFESEMLIRKLSGEIPIAVFRPSIIVGDSRTGVTSSFNVLYMPLRLIQSGLIKYLPGYASTRLDVVPVDYVCEALTMVTFGCANIAGKTFHLVAGEDNSPTAREIVRLAREYFDKAAPHRRVSGVTFLSTSQFQNAKRSCSTRDRAILNAMDEYAPYLCVQRSFDDANTRQALTASGLKPPAFKDYYRNLLRYCLETDWGKRHRLAA